MFKLFRYFSVTSAVALGIVAFLLVLTFRFTAHTSLVGMTEQQNVALARAFANSVWPQFLSYLELSKNLDGEALRDRPETEKIRKTLETLTTNLSVIKVKIFGLNGRTIYSTDASELGERLRNSDSFARAAKEGRPTSKLNVRTYNQLPEEHSRETQIEDRDYVESYLPIHSSSGKVEGVFELYSDVTSSVKKIQKTQRLITISLILLFTILYGILSMFVFHGDKILRVQYSDLLQKNRDIANKNISLLREIKARERAEKALLLIRQVEQKSNTDPRTQYLIDASRELGTIGQSTLTQIGTPSWSSSLRTRFFLPMFLVGLVVGIGAIWIDHETDSKELRHQFDERAATLANSINHLILVSENISQVQHFVDEVMAEMTQVKLVVVTQRDTSQIIVSSVPSWIGRKASKIIDAHNINEAMPALQKGQFESHFDSDRGEFVYVSPLLPNRLRIARPNVGGTMSLTSVEPKQKGAQPTAVKSNQPAASSTRKAGFVGAILVKMDGSGLQMASTGLLLQKSVFILGVVLVLLATAYILMQRQVYGPLSSIVSAMKRRSAGETAVRTMVATSDEIGEVACELNSLIGSIEENQYQLTKTAQYLGAALEQAELSNRQFEQEIVDRSQAEAKLEGVLTRLRESTYSQREFIANAAHELRTPLAVLRARFESMENAESANLTADIDRMGRLISQLLEFARFDTLQADFNEEVDLISIAREVICDLAPVAVKENKKMSLDTEACPAIVTGNAESFYVALRNVVENALSYTAAGTNVEIEIKDGEISVRDRGPGIPHSERSAIFQRFWRGRNSSGRIGTGLGLALVAEVINAHGGTVEVSDRTGGGTVVALKFPAGGGSGHRKEIPQRQADASGHSRPIPGSE